MKKLATTTIAVLLSVVSIYAQKDVKPVSMPAVPGTLVYSLPKTALTIDVKITKVTQKAGIYAYAAKQYFGLENSEIVSKDDVKYQVEVIGIRTSGIADPNKRYKVTANAGSNANVITLNKQGIIQGINAGSKPEEKINNEYSQEEEIPVLFNKAVLPQEYFTTPVNERAELLANLIYKYREYQEDLATGFADNIPANEGALRIMFDELKSKENDILDFFRGKTGVTTSYKPFELFPETPLKNQPIFHFSPSKGIVNDTRAEIYAVSLQSTKIDIADTSASSKKEEVNGFYYNVPAPTTVQILNGNKTVYEQEIEIAQFGVVDTLPVGFVDKNNVSISFDTTTGAIQIVKK